MSRTCQIITGAVLMLLFCGLQFFQFPCEFLKFPNCPRSMAYVQMVLNSVKWVALWFGTFFLTYPLVYEIYDSILDCVGKRRQRSQERGSERAARMAPNVGYNDDVRQAVEISG